MSNNGVTLGVVCESYGVRIRELCGVCGLGRSGMYRMYRTKPGLVEVILMGMRVQKVLDEFRYAVVSRIEYDQEWLEKNRRLSDDG